MATIDFTFRCDVSPEQLAENVKHNKARGLPALGRAWPVKPALAIVGGAPDLLGRLDELRRFDGDIWAINGVWTVLRNHGIDCAFYTIDPHPIVMALSDSVDRGIVASCVDPCTIDVMADGAAVELFDLGVGNGKIAHGPTSATAAPHLAVERGHRRIYFYGCSGTYTHRTHVHKDESDIRNKIYIQTCRGEFCTEPQFYEQSKCLATCIQAAPDVFFDKSGGLLGALVQDMEHAVVATNRRLYESMKREKQARTQAAVG